MERTHTTLNEQEQIEIFGAREHNLKDIDLTIPRNKLVVFTGLSGSGKSSLAFDTIFAEGQRRYLESFSAYARQFVGDMKRPDVDKINGLSPVISIEQKTVSRNPRSTVGTITEIYDFMRLLFARAADAYSHLSGQKMVKLTEDEIIDSIIERFTLQKIVILAPLIKGRKGHYRELFELTRKRGFMKVRLDGEIQEIKPGMQADRYKIHDIEVVIDRLEPDAEQRKRVAESVRTAFKLGHGSLLILHVNENRVYPYSKFLMDPVTGLSYDEPQPNTFSFNSPYGYCEKCEGLGVIHEVDLKHIIPDPSKSINKGGIVPIGELRENWTFNQLRSLAKKYKFSLADPISQISQEALNMILYGSPDKQKSDPAAVRISSAEQQWNGVVNIIRDNYFEGNDDSISEWASDFMSAAVCPVCQGARLKPEALHYRIGGKNIAELSRINIDELKDWFDHAEQHMSERQNIIARDILKEIRSRIGFLSGVGLNYLNLHSPSSTLSGGEAQRIRLATQIGSQLSNVLYILDEPSIGLHQRDNHKLIESLKELRDIGNTVIVVEHDKDMILESDYVVDIGPRAGAKGGHIVAQGDLKTFLKQDSITARYLNGTAFIAVPKKRRKGNGKFISLKGASGNNLKETNADFPLGTFTCVTGVSGSGKSTLINETLFPILHNHVYATHHRALGYHSITGVDQIDKVIRIDQSPIGRTPRSNPATYVGVFTDIRTLFAELPEAKIRGYKPGRFSFNVKGGRCEDCGGGGSKVIEMNFLPSVEVLCDTCQGKRYNRETLEVRYRGKSISEVLDMSIDQALEFFENMPHIQRKIRTMQEVGLGYITLGQSSTTLSGGEAQRVKLATELSKKDTGNTFYILDEPTTGLHFEDVKVLLEVLQKLVDKGNTVLVIEHNLDVVKTADWVIDIGPEGGSGGGQVIAEGTPEQIAKSQISHTGRFLKEELR